jgi:phosphoribosylformylglycinamidine synthase
MRFGVVVFPGSNCDHDAWYALSHNLGQQAEFIWHDAASLGNVDAVILPGGFAYGDYLRCGAIAKFSPVMAAVRKFAEQGGLVLGICNGFQILVEAGLLPGALLRNRDLKFVCRTVTLRVENNATPFTASAAEGQLLRVPVAHGEGCYFADQRTLDHLERDRRVVLRYVDNPNGSLRDIAGISNDRGNVMGLMPHPERAADALMGSTDGRVILESMVHSLVSSINHAA